MATQRQPSDIFSVINLWQYRVFSQLGELHDASVKQLTKFRASSLPLSELQVEG